MLLPCLVLLPGAGSDPAIAWSRWAVMVLAADRNWWLPLDREAPDRVGMPGCPQAGLLFAAGEVGGEEPADDLAEGGVAVGAPQ